jgi:hypothetical protein
MIRTIHLKVGRVDRLLVADMRMTGSWMWKRSGRYLVGMFQPESLNFHPILFGMVWLMPGMIPIAMNRCLIGKWLAHNGSIRWFDMYLDIGW